jgi:cell shape-determining protein MreC
MKTNYLPKSRTNSRGKKLKLVLAVSLMFVILTGLFSVARGSLVSLVSPIWRAENTVSQALASFGANLQSKRDLEVENKRLLRQLESYQLERQVLANFAEREARILALLGRSDESGGVASAVLVHPPQTAYDALIIDSGRAQGIQVGARVILSEGVELGEVESVSARQSVVKLYSTPGAKTNAILERGDIPVIILGEGAGNFKLILPRDLAVEVGDRIISTDINSRLIAVVEDVSQRPTDSFKVALAKGPANIFNIRFVLVLP